MQVYFCPKDDCNGELTKTILSAKEYVYCALFDLNLEDVKEALYNQSEKINVSVVVDDHNYKKVNEFDFVRKDTSGQLSHNKFCVIDDNLVWTGSFNPTENGAFLNNNNALRIPSKLLAQNYKSEFFELWNKKFGRGYKVKNPKIILNGKLIENYFCPEDYCGYKVIDVLDNARESIYFMIFSFTHDYIGQKILEKHNQSLEIKGVFERTQKNAYTEFDKFNESGMEIKWDMNSNNMHHKVFIIDNKTVVTGSFNPSKNADTNNDENVIIIHDPKIAQKYLKEFEFVWNPLAGEITDFLFISEVYYDTDGKDSELEFIELYNPFDYDIDVNYWKLNRKKINHRLKGIIKSKETMVINPKFSLPNKGGTLFLKNKLGQEIDKVSWELNSSLEAQKGQSIQRKTFYKVNNEEEWFVSEPTKGKV